jgi:predicted Zn-ribbon and HTH transcriptional regulator
MIRLDKPAECPSCGYPFGTVIPDECPGCNAEIIGVTRVDDVRYKFDRTVTKHAGDELHMNLKIPAGGRGLAAVRREQDPPKVPAAFMPAAVAAHAKIEQRYAEALFDYRHVCESIGATPLPLDQLKKRAATSTRSIVQVVDDAKREAISTYQREQDRKLDKPVCVKCGRAVDPWSIDYTTGTCSSCIAKAKP